MQYLLCEVGRVVRLSPDGHGATMSGSEPDDSTENRQNLPNLQEGSRNKPPIKRPCFTVEQVGWPSRACACRLESEPVERDALVRQ